MTSLRTIVTAAALLLIAVAALALYRADSGIEVTRSTVGDTPVSVFRSATLPAGARRPVVVISHGFAGSQQLMEPFAVTLARNGYLAVTFDYYGHGRSAEPLRGDVTKVEGATEYLLAQTRKVADYALGLPDANGKLAILGHSMASDIVVRYAQRDSRVAATVAVSMFSTAVTERAPANLLVIVGGWEGFLKEEALRVQGLVTKDPAPDTTVAIDDGNARRISFADGVEHVGVLYSAKALGESVAWLNAVFERSSAGTVDVRGPWIMLLLLGVGLLAWPLASWLPRVSEPPVGAALNWRRLLPAGLAPAIATPLLLAAFPADFMGVLVGGYLAVHFLLYGLIGAGFALWFRRHQARRPFSLDPRRGAIAVVLATAYCAVLVAWIMDSYVTSFAITPLRAPLFALMLVGTASYFLADEWLVHGASTARGGHLFTRLCFLLSLALAVALSFEDLFFLLIIAGVIVIYFLVYGLFSRWLYQSTGHPWIGAVANSIAFAWALAAVFPLMAG